MFFIFITIIIGIALVLYTNPSKNSVSNINTRIADKHRIEDELFAALVLYYSAPNLAERIKYKAQIHQKVDELNAIKLLL
jgi:hypothetical protein